jgi:HSP90 family molecular chaperone
MSGIPFQVPGWLMWFVCLFHCLQVLYLIEPIDEVAIQNLQTYKEKKFVDISKEDLELG